MITITTTDKVVRQFRVNPSGRGAASHLHAFAQAEAIAESIRAARASLPPLERGDKDARAWLEALRRIGAGAGTSFRDADVTRDRLWSLVESASAPLAQRIAATIALRAAGVSDEEQPRLRVLVDQCAEEEHRARLRVAIEAEGDEELAEALARAESSTR